MKAYEYLAKLPTFSLKDVTAITHNRSTSMSLIRRLLEKNYAVRIRKGLYSCIDLTTGNIVANKYQIACAINSDAYISYHTAAELYGLTDQIYNIVYVSSKKRFNSFEFMGDIYRHIYSPFEEGVIEAKNTRGIRMTNKERTYVDSINMISKISGVEEIINITKQIQDLNFKKMMRYMEGYNKKVLYQKIGYFLENFYLGGLEEDDFLKYCHKKSKGSVRYLIQSHEGVLDSKWNLIIPTEYQKKEENIIDYI